MSKGGISRDTLELNEIKTSRCRVVCIRDKGLLVS